MDSLFYLAFTDDYAEPIPLVGPYESYDAAVLGFWRSQVEAGVVTEGEIDPHLHYLDSDGVRIAKVDSAA